MSLDVKRYFYCVSPIITLFINYVLGLEFTFKEDEWHVSGGGRLSRADAAIYLLKTAKEHLHSKKIVAISTTN